MRVKRGPSWAARRVKRSELAPLSSSSSSSPSPSFSSNSSAYLGPVVVPALGELHEVVAGLRGLFVVELDDKVASRGRESDAGSVRGSSHLELTFSIFFPHQTPARAFRKAES